LLRACRTHSRTAPNSRCLAITRLFASYHPSQQNTQTGRLTPEMFYSVAQRIRRFLDALPRP